MIDDPPDALKPGMNSAVNIQVRYEPEAIKTPIQSVYAVGNRYFCLLAGEEGNDRWETREIEIDGDNSKFVLVKSGLDAGEQVVMNPGAYKEQMDLPELDNESNIEMTDSMKAKVNALKAGAGDSKRRIGEVSQAEKEPAESGAQGGSRPGGQRGGRGGFNMPANGAALIKDKDSDGDGKLTKDEAGSPYSFFFDRVDSNSDGFLDEAELDESIKQMKRRMQSGGFGGGRPGGGGPR